MGRKELALLILDSLKCLQELSPVDVCIIGAIFRRDVCKDTHYVISGVLMSTFTASLERVEAEYLLVLSVQDCVHLYREVLACSLSLPGLRETCVRIQKRLAARIRSGADLPESLLIDVLLDTLGDEVDVGIFKALTSALRSRLPRASEQGLDLEDSKRQAREIIAVQEAFDRKNLAVSPEFVELVRKFIVS
jgi:hypothetical protein